VQVSTAIGLGGGTLINSEMFVRGNPDDYNTWEREYGATGWGYSDVLPYFKRLEVPSPSPLSPATFSLFLCRITLSNLP
jgi:choline dehydrogenase-like flavoprotein